MSLLLDLEEVRARPAGRSSRGPSHGSSWKIPRIIAANRWLLVLGDALYSVNVCLRLTVRHPARAILMIWSGARGPTMVDAAAALRLRRRA